MTTIINEQKTNAKNFAYDGCHKIYLIEDMTDMENAKKIGYEIHPITDLEKIWNKSCSLRFINNWKLDKTFVPQFKKANFKFETV